jgi:hypothetical protein
VNELQAVGEPADRHRRGWLAPIGAVAVLIAVIVGAGLLQLRGGEHAGAGTATLPPTPAGTGFVARLPIGEYGKFSWSPDGAHLLLSDGSGSRVYDRFGKLVSTFGQKEGWLDASQLVAGDGHVANIGEGYTTESVWKGGVVANGHGSAAIIKDTPLCPGDPWIDWYANGQYVKANEETTPFGWSPDGKLVLLGHMDCTVQDAMANGWKGPVQIIDFATRKVLATAPGVRGDMAFNPSGTRLAAESDANLEIVDIATGQIKTVPDARLLGWSGDDHLAYVTAGGTIADAGATANIPPAGGIVAEWSIPSAIGVRLACDNAGKPLRIANANGKQLLDLTSASLGRLRDLGEATTNPQPRYSALCQNPWSPDGRMLALRSTSAIELYSVEP